MEIRKLKIAYIAKGLIAGTLILLAIAFAALLFTAFDAGGAYKAGSSSSQPLSQSIRS